MNNQTLITQKQLREVRRVLDTLKAKYIKKYGAEYIESFWGIGLWN